MTRTRLIALASASLVLLTGCNAVPGFNPGVAARVDGDTISVSTVDDVARSYCEAIEDQLDVGQALPQHYLRSQVASNLALRSAADQFAAEQGVSADQEYADAVAQVEPQLAELTEDQREALIDVEGTAVYVKAIEKAAGAAILDEPATTAETDEAARKAGHEAFLAWLDDNDVRLNPRFGVSLEGGAVAPVDTSLSYPLGDTSTKAGTDQPDFAYGATLPRSQRCG